MIKINLIKIISSIVIVGLIATVIGFVLIAGFITYVYPPIEEYEFEGSETELVENLNLLRDRYQVILTDTTGEYPDDYNVYFEILDTDSCSYHLKYTVDRKKEIDISLTGVFDLRTNKGGYSNSNEEVIYKLKNKFEVNLIDRIRTSTNKK